MPREAVQPQTPTWLTDGSASAGEGRLLQQRLGLFAGIAFAITAAFYIVGQALAALGQEKPLPPAGHATLSTMILLEGVTWFYCRGGARPESRLRAERVVHILRQVLGALHEAHGVGLVHRDVKPSNVMLCERGGLFDVAKVVDFGLVKDQDAADGLTHDGTLVGTPLYLAPEAIRTSGADARSDLYSTGALGYFLATGQHVFGGKTVIEICGHHLHTPPVPPSARLGRPFPRDLEAWILACLEKDPARRPPTAGAALAALERCPLDEAWSQERARAWWADKGRGLRAARHQSAPEATVTTLSGLVPLRTPASERPG